MYLVGKNLGIDDDLNMCADGLEPAIEYSDMILRQVISKNFDSQESSKMCKDMAKHLLDGVNILNPFIDQTAYHLWSDRLLNPHKPHEKTGMQPFSHFLFNTQILVLESLMHVQVMGQLIRMLANNLMKLNIYLAADWSDFIVDNFNSPKADTGLGRLQAFLAIPVFTVISASAFAFQELEKNKVVPLLFVILLIALVLMI